MDTSLSLSLRKSQCDALIGQRIKGFLLSPAGQPSEAKWRQTTANLHLIHHRPTIALVSSHW